MLSEVGYSRAEAYLRWVANLEKERVNINDIPAEKRKGKVFQTTIKWGHCEWTFDCSQSDYEGHGGAGSAFPHFHFQMRLDRKPFFDFSDGHIPLSEDDLFELEMLRRRPGNFRKTHVEGGLGMADAMSLSPQEIIDYSNPTEDVDRAPYRLVTMVRGTPDQPIDIKRFAALIEEAKGKGVTMASLLQKEAVSGGGTITLVGRGEATPDIAGRDERKR